MLTKKDYEAIAEILDGVYERDAIYNDDLVLADVVVELANYFADHDNTFDWDSFINACYRRD